jgi:protein involved in polysaccharide export with SLBB domain
MTLQDGITAAGGFTDFARRRLFLYHSDGLAERYRLGPNFALTNNVALRPGDKLVNPRE